MREFRITPGSAVDQHIIPGQLTARSLDQMLTESRNPSARDRLRAVIQTLGVSALIAFAVSRGSYEIIKQPVDVEPAAVDTGTWVINPEVKIRRYPSQLGPMPGSNPFSFGSVAEVNGKPYDGHSLIRIKNVPLVVGDDPYSTNESNPDARINWLKLGLKVHDGLYGDFITFGYVATGASTAGLVQEIKTGEHAIPTVNNGELGAITSDGRIVSTGITKLIENPQSR